MSENTIETKENLSLEDRLEQLVKEFAVQLTQLQNLINNSTRGELKRAILNALTKDIMDKNTLQKSNNREIAMFNLILKLIELKIIIIADVYKLAAEEKNKQLNEENKNETEINQ